MISFKNNLNNRQTIKNYDMNMNHFGNDWGLFVDIEKEKRILNLIEEIDKKEYSIKDHDQNLSTYKLKIDALDSMVKGLNADKSHL